MGVGRWVTAGSPPGRWVFAAGVGRRRGVRSGRAPRRSSRLRRGYNIAIHHSLISRTFKTDLGRWVLGRWVPLGVGWHRPLFGRWVFALGAVGRLRGVGSESFLRRWWPLAWDYNSPIHRQELSRTFKIDLWALGVLGVGCPWALGEGRVAPGALGACGGRRGAARCPIGVGLAAF